MGRHPEGQRAETRERIVREAARALRTGGLAGVTVPGVMREVGLTHGGFYAHFASREALLEEALGAAAREKLDALLAHARTQPNPLAAVIRGYLSRSHRDDPAGGCLLPCLAAEVGRQGPQLRAALAGGLRVLTGEVAGLDPALSPAQARTLVSTLVGTLTLARTLPDPAESDALLRDVRKTLTALVERGPSSAPENPGGPISKP